jgi:FkbM family methyltransferase
MRHTAKQAVQRIFRSLGLDIRWHVPHPAHALWTLLDLYGVDTVFDIGANSGDSGQYLRNIGFDGRIVSFEPVSEVYRQLAARAASDPMWVCENVALGEEAGERRIHVSGAGGISSSLLASTGHVEACEPELSVVGSEMVRVETLQSIVARHYPQGDRLFLKIDAQGYERRILEGAGPGLEKVVGMRIELSLVSSYEGAPLMTDMLPYLTGLGYRLCGIEEAWSNRATQEVYEVDAVLFRTGRLARPDTITRGPSTAGSPA